MKIINIMNRFVGSHKKLNYILKCIKRFGDESYIDKMLERDPEYVHFEHWGQCLPDKIIYFIDIGIKGDGFFAEYHRLLDYLYYADKHSLTPYVYFNSDFSYIDSNGNDKNYSDVFFEPYSGLSYDDVLKGKNVIRSHIAHIDYNKELDRKNAYILSDKYISELALITRKYIKFNDKVQQYVDESLKEMNFDHNILGVHFRGSDYKNSYNGHPVYVSPDEYIVAVKEIITKGNYNRIFLATDDIEALKAFQEAFGTQLIYYKDVLRTDGKTSVAFLDSNRDNHHYKLGLEVIRDMITLSKCDALVAGLSQVSICAIITNRAWENEYSLLRVLDKGINSNLRYYLG